jgi:hypothetical protein
MIYDQAANYVFPVSKIVPNVYAEKYKQRSMGQITGVRHANLLQKFVHCRFTDVSATTVTSNCSAKT